MSMDEALSRLPEEVRGHAAAFRYLLHADADAQTDRIMLMSPSELRGVLCAAVGLTRAVLGMNDTKGSTHE